ncbi:MAG TPA: thiamine pyrophosphate-requiring protein [Candidatus Cybelea sp.]|jgi:pyruvate dehydrogenase (quinone)|nr:thiamine pyrophosphate-requiring protein [Candidatus Cybelea sp.]
MTQPTASGFLLQRLIDWGVQRIYGYPGDGINGLIGSLEAFSDRLEFIQVRHEEMAAFMACAHAKFTGEVGVCMATSGPGAIHLLNGLYDAKNDHAPVVAIVGQAATTALGGSYQQEVDLQTLFHDVSEYAATIASTAATRHVVDRAFRTAIGMRGVATVIFPKDLQEERYAPPPEKHNTLHSGVGYARPIVVPQESDLRRAAELLNGAERVAILAGAGAKHAYDELIDVADTLKACCAKALLGKDVLPDDLPWVTGTIGLLGTRPSSDIMAQCDALLMIGTNFPYAEFLPKEGDARAVQIDLDPRNLGLRYPVEVNLAGDAAATLRALLPHLDRKSDGSWRERIAKDKAEWSDIEARRAHIEADPVNPMLYFYSLNERLPSNAILTGDAGTPTNWMARFLTMRRGNKLSLSGSLATMGSAVPYAIAAKFAFPDRPVIAFAGDGAMQMNGINELITVYRYWNRWSDPRLIFFVLNNTDLNQVTWEQRILGGSPRNMETQPLPDFPYAAFGESLGFLGIRVDRPDRVGEAWDRALNADRPVVFEALANENIATLPPHISREEAMHFLKSVPKDPEAAGIIKESVRQVLSGILPGRSPRQ